MLKQERQAFIVHQVNLHNRVLSSDLSTQMNVSEDTIRRDLQELADKGKIIKVHGGALSRSFSSSINSSSVYNIDAKKSIAQKAASLIKDGMFVMSTGGTTIIEMAKALPDNLHATFITGSLPAALEYVHHPTIEVIFIGDKLSKSSQITIGADAILKIRQFKVDLCFLGINALDVKHGLTDNDYDVVQVKKAMIESADNVIALSISEKINTSQSIQVCKVNELDTLITELSPDDKIFQPYKNAGLTIL
ncbi:DeoR family transcriptional regulator [Lacibacter cauensis]|uniref:DeoR family transcriptional regulator n=1 Tax=Lacibacter cauensis TaxID=510947 RepID=A0A562SHI7_9BACT|nr:DeoR/GlpR family DNA-binding transcription regulator [Lacibacter cauensis]TWI80230.1 DeoR family transcriptional regulator [Lacibacter cauensis]